jgi:putative Holliday junction resolvase
MRFLGVDFGRKRIGLALSDSTAMLARPWRTIAAGGSPAQSAAGVAAAIGGAGEEVSDLCGIVVGLPRRLGGDDSVVAGDVRVFAAALGELTGLAVHLQDEQLTSREAEARLAERERDWRRRKAKLDAAAAAIVLQDFLDARGRGN